MLLEEDPSTLISHTTQNFNIAPDRHAVSRVAESLSTLQQARDLRLRESETNLKKLARTLNTLQSQHQEVTSSHSSAEHASLISRLDTQKFRVAKNVSDLEMETERLQTQLAEMQARLQELELQGVDGDATTGTGGESGNGNGANGGGMRSVEDEVLLRLKVYRSLGIEIEREEQDGEFTRAVVRNDRRGDVCVVNVDRHRFSRFFYANYFWQTL
ncbi:Spc24 subunit of Ndc80-domain-containing protein [Copromyces sp. CBS 386.78]|nr:Spc24 subunit of Ndc80-domain-containing protein [Copromyces sp. CBS 386.78]